MADIIRDKQRQLSEAEALVLRLRSELTGAKQALLGDAQPLPRRDPGSSTDMAEAVLKDIRRAMHVNDIISAIEREFHVQVRYATLVGNLSRLVSKGKTFERTGPNRFGLLEWAEQREADELFAVEEWERENVNRE